MDKKKINQENKNLRDFSPGNFYRRIKPLQEKSDNNNNNQRSKSRNYSEILNNNSKNPSNLSKRKT